MMAAKASDLFSALQAAQQVVCQRALATLSAEDSEDLYFSGGQHVTELHAALVSKFDCRFFPTCCPPCPRGLSRCPYGAFVSSGLIYKIRSFIN